VRVHVQARFRQHLGPAAVDPHECLLIQRSRERRAVTDDVDSLADLAKAIVLPKVGVRPLNWKAGDEPRIAAATQ
jgi:hypothetical protein